MKETKYDTIQIENDNEDVIGEMIIQNDNFLHANIFADFISPDINDIQELRKFLYIVEQKMKECENTKIYFD